jgi:hypothetical protein
MPARHARCCERRQGAHELYTAWTGTQASVGTTGWCSFAQTYVYAEHNSRQESIAVAAPNHVRVVHCMQHAKAVRTPAPNTRCTRRKVTPKLALLWNTFEPRTWMAKPTPMPSITRPMYSTAGSMQTHCREQVWCAHGQTQSKGEDGGIPSWFTAHLRCAPQLSESRCRPCKLPTARQTMRHEGCRNKGKHVYQAAVCRNMRHICTPAGHGRGCNSPQR